MARITYQNRLENIINNPYFSARDKDFAGDLLTYLDDKRERPVIDVLYNVDSLESFHIISLPIEHLRESSSVGKHPC